jgi:flagellar hook-associated protein 3 FlgL
VSLRVTQKSLTATTSKNLQVNLSQMQRLQEQLSSGKLITKPSDSPTGTVSALKLRADLRRGEQLERIANDSIAWRSAAASTMFEGLSVLNRARDLVLQGMNASSDVVAREALAVEIEGLREHMLGVANTKHLGRPLFGGTSSNVDAFAADGTYQGDAGAIERTVMDGLTVQVNVTGSQVFGPDGINIFDVMQSMVDNLRNDPAALGADLDALDDRAVAFRSAHSQVGARHNQVEAMRERTESARLNSENALAQVESIDLPATIMELKLQEVAYQAALSATARVIQPSLLDFLR